METSKTRIRYSIVLLCLGLVLAILPQGRTPGISPEELMKITDDNSFLSSDQVARMIASEDSTVRFIDLRTPEEFRKESLPGAMNIPVNITFTQNLRSSLGSGSTKNVLYSANDVQSAWALVMARGMGFTNTFVMRGGMNDWISTIINSTFSGERITARENALFEARTRAKNIFNEYNSMPDSLKTLLLASRKTGKKKLDGGCE